MDGSAFCTRSAALVAIFLGLTSSAFAQPGAPQQALPYEGRPSIAPLQQPAGNQPPIQLPTLQQAGARPQPATQAPFATTAAEQAAVDQALLAWEKHSQGVKTFSCSFTRLEYDLVFGTPNHHQIESHGEIKYAAPDKGLFQIGDVKIFNVQANRYEPSPTDLREKWICDGASIIEFDPRKKQVIQRKLPPQLQGRAIADGPLPFLFGADATKLKMRYFMRLMTPPDAQGQIWIEAYPRFQQDAANFKVATLILSKELTPYALRLVDPTENKPQVYQFSDIKQNAWQFLAGDFSKPATPLGWKLVIEDPQVQGAAPGGEAPRGIPPENMPGANPNINPNAQAIRPAARPQ